MNTIGVQSIDEIAKKILILWLSETSGSEGGSSMKYGRKRAWIVASKQNSNPDIKNGNTQREVSVSPQRCLNEASTLSGNVNWESQKTSP